MAEKKINQVLFFTGSYPFSSASEDTFIDPELPFLLSTCTSVVIIPKSSIGNRKKLPQSIIVENTLAELFTHKKIRRFNIKTLILALTSPYFFREIIKKPTITLQIQIIGRIIYDLGSALQTKRWLIKYIKNNNVDLKRTIFYTYWLDEVSFGISLAKKKYPMMQVISRAHGVDIYEEQNFASFIPFRPEIFSSIDKVFPDSEKGRKYLSTHFPEYRARFFTSRLGVEGQNDISTPSNDGVFRIVSCSYLIPLKRIDLLIKGLQVLGNLQTTHQFEWTHIGDGPLRNDLEQMAEDLLPPNVNHRFLGYVPEGGVISYYQNNPVDVFVNVSFSEGTPVSIMEAQSCGIVVIATDAGGNSEIVSMENGLLLSLNPDPLEIADAISVLLCDDKMLKSKKIKSYENWKNYYNSRKNFQDFYNNLKHM